MESINVGSALKYKAELNPQKVGFWHYLQSLCPQPEFPVSEGAMEHQGHLPSLLRWLQIHPQHETLHGH